MAAALEFADGGWTEATAGHPALELVNTVAWRLNAGRRIDRITDATELVRWATFVGLLEDRQVRRITTQARRDRALGAEIAGVVRGVREQLYVVIRPLAVGDVPLPTDADQLVHGLSDRLSRLPLSSAMPPRWSQQADSLDQLPDVLAAHAWDLLSHEDPARLRQCRDDDCGWLFLDRTKNRSRVWCSSADCGNRMRARRHRGRHSRSAKVVDGRE